MPAVTADPRPRNTQGQFEDEAGTATGPAAMKLAYKPGMKAPALLAKISNRMKSTDTQSAPVATEFSALTGAQVDRDKLVVFGVSVITSGVTAIGHDLDVDDTTLREMCDCANRKGKVKTKENHKTGVGETCGWLTNFRIEGNKLKADWHLLKSYPRAEHFLEIAENIPTECGFSASFAMPERDHFGADGRKKARCANLLSVDFVDRPAANPAGLFSAKPTTPIDKKEHDMSDKTPDTATLLAAIEKIGNQVTAFDARLKNFEDAAAAPSLEDALDQLHALLDLTDEELVAKGTSRAEVEDAIADLTGEDGADAPDAGAGEGDDKNPQLSALEKRVARFEARDRRNARETELAAADAEITEFAARFDAVVELSETQAAKIVELTAKCEALEATLKKHGHKPIEFSAGGEGNQGGQRTATKFLELAAVEEESAKSSGKPITSFQAQDIVRKKNPAAFEAYRKELGVTK